MFVDRFDRKQIMIAADVIRAVLVLSLPVLLPLNIAWLYVIVMVSSAVGQFFDRAHESVLPEVATDEELAAANSFMAISSFGATAVGFAASGLIGSQNVNVVFMVDAASFIFSAVCIYLIRVPKMEVHESTTVRAVVHNLRAGAKFLASTPMLRALFLVSIPIFVSFGLANSLLLPFARKALNASEFQYGLQEGLTSIGFVAGSLLMARLTDRLREGQWVAISIIGMALAGIATPDGGYRGLSTMTPGGFFGEIAALTGAARTANVVADEAARVMRVPAGTMRSLMSNPKLSQLFLSKITERLSRTSTSDLPRFAGYDQAALRDLRTASAEAG